MEKFDIGAAPIMTLALSGAAAHRAAHQDRRRRREAGATAGARRGRRSRWWAAASARSRSWSDPAPAKGYGLSRRTTWCRRCRRRASTSRAAAPWSRGAERSVQASPPRRARWRRCGRSSSPARAARRSGWDVAHVLDGPAEARSMARLGTGAALGARHPQAVRLEHGAGRRAASGRAWPASRVSSRRAAR